MSRPTVALAMVPLLTAEVFGPRAKTRLEAVAEVLDAEPLTAFGEPRALEILPRTEILLTGWGCPPIDAQALRQAPGLRAIVHAAGTVKQHITDACWERGLRITSAAAANALPVAEYTLAAILFANKRAFPIQRRYAEAREFRWWPLEFPGLGNYDKVVGIVGASMVGRRVIDLLRPFDFEVIVFDPFLSEEDAGGLGVRKVELDELMRTADIVSLHAPALPQTHEMISREMLALMKNGSTFVNTARGSIVDGAALTEELGSGRIYAVIDTTEPEILPADSPLYELPNVFLTPHIAGAMGSETQRLGELAIDEIERYARGEAFRYQIRQEDLPRLA